MANKMLTEQNNCSGTSNTVAWWFRATSVSEHSLVGIVPDQQIKGDALLCFESCNLNSPQLTSVHVVILNYSHLGARWNAIWGLCPHCSEVAAGWASPLIFASGLRNLSFLLVLGVDCMSPPSRAGYDGVKPAYTQLSFSLIFLWIFFSSIRFFLLLQAFFVKELQVIHSQRRYQDTSCFWCCVLVVSFFKKAI